MNETRFFEVKHSRTCPYGLYAYNTRVCQALPFLKDHKFGIVECNQPGFPERCPLKKYNKQIQPTV